MGVLAGQGALVTGGSRGIGRAIVKRLAADGAGVVFSFIADEAAAQCVAAGAQVYLDAIGAELLSRIVQQRDSALESARRLGQGPPADAAGVSAVRRELEEELAPLAQVIDRAAQLAKAARDLAAADKQP